MNAAQESQLRSVTERALRAGNWRDAVSILQQLASDQQLPEQRRADYWSNLAVCHLNLGEFSDAITAANAALALRPSHADAWCNLASAYWRNHIPDNAIRAAREATRYQPKREFFWAVRARIALSLAYWEEAIACHEHIFAFHPDDPVHWSRAQDVRLLAGKAPVCIHEIRQFYRRHPTHPDVRRVLAKALCDLQEFSQAAKLLANPQGIPKELQAEIHFRTGQLQPGRDLLQQLPTRAKKYVLSLRFLADTSDWESLVQQARQYATDPAVDDDPEQVTELHFVLGKIAELTDAKTAFFHFQTGHKILAHKEPWDEEAFRRLQIHCATEPWREISPVSEYPANPQWLFLVGMPRTGTTLMEQILGQHSQIQATGERHEWQQIAQAYAHHHDDNALRHATAIHASLPKKLAARPVRWITDKMPANFWAASMLLHLQPTAKVLWLQRDPLDTARSIWSQHFLGVHPYAHDLQNLARFYRWQEELREQAMTSYPDRVLSVSYENIVTNFRDTVIDVLKFLDLSWEESCASFYQNSRTVITASRDQVRKPLYRSSIGKGKLWGDLLDPFLQEFYKQ